MPTFGRSFKYLLILGAVAVLLPISCLLPTEPEFRLDDGFYLAEGTIFAGDETSEIRVRSSAFSSVQLRLEPVLDARVVSIREDGRTVSWTLADSLIGNYQPPEAFRAEVGETWHFEIDFPDGTKIVSDPETIPPQVPLTGMEVRFVQNSIFDESRNRFIPRFEIFLDYDDPAGEKNYYQWRYYHWEEIDVCASCNNAIWRNGECITQEFFIFRYDYLCFPPLCYELTQGVEIRFGDDELSDGAQVRGLPVGAIEFDRFGLMMVFGELLSITREAEAYGKVIEDLVNANNGLNAPIPAPLNGNLRNVNNQGREALGFLGAASVSRISELVERGPQTGNPLFFDPVIRLEDPLIAPRAPCAGVNRSPTPPPGWP
ncbi:DUF4249 domain-containing protein [Lewinella sp. W8]|uniref:DUF4249 domain-containing protein n=1 Tax=Lewinella sp. W8 TaxID=2528208 RepID=UPI001068B26D|nr:DUF4249 domain-containing protein [Lewinella sp. W8]MTB53954.1 DUF4249 family protein [Lewinella sp. W8]